MAHQSLYRRYRPQRFEEIKGQRHVVSALRNAADEDRVSHAYLFSGPRGTGKTSTARILAKVMNCTAVEGGEPCGVCDSCVSIEAGNSFDVTELDAASNRRIDDIRDLIGTTALASPGRTRMYILDEVHMLTKEASAALLKTLEEPPDHVVFVLATTDPQLVLPTIRSRTQHLEFTLLPADDLNSLVGEVVADAGLDVNDEGVARALRDGAGSARDTLSALDRIVASGGVVAEGESIVEIMDALAERDTGAALVALHHAIERGRDPRVVGEQLLSELRDAFLVLMAGEVTHLTDSVLDRVRGHADRLRAPAITRALEAIGESLVEMRQSADPRVPLEVALVRLTRPELDTTPAGLVDRIERLERQARSGGGSAPATATEAPAPAVRAGPGPSQTASPGPATPSPGDRADGPAAAARARLAETTADTGDAGDAGDTAASTPSQSAVPSSGAAPTSAAASRPRPALGRRAREGAAASLTAPDQAAPTVSADSAESTGEPGRASGPSTAPAGAEPPDIEVVDTAPEAVEAGGAIPADGESSTGAPTQDAPASGSTPTRDAIVMAWGDTLLDNLRPKLRALFAAGHFTDVVDDTARFALPNDAHRERCEPFRADVEKVLAGHFEGPVALELVVEGGESSAGGGSAAGGSEPAAAKDTRAEREEESIDMDALEDAGSASTGVDQLAEVFGAVEMVEETEEGSS